MSRGRFLRRANGPGSCTARNCIIPPSAKELRSLNLSFLLIRHRAFDTQEFATQWPFSVLLNLLRCSRPPNRQPAAVLQYLLSSLEIELPYYPQRNLLTRTHNRSCLSLSHNVMGLRTRMLSRSRDWRFANDGCGRCSPHANMIRGQTLRLRSKKEGWEGRNDQDCEYRIKLGEAEHVIGRVERAG